MKGIVVGIAILMTFMGFGQKDSIKFTLGTQSNVIYKPLNYLQSVFIGFKIKGHTFNLGTMLYSNLLERELSESYPIQSKRFTIGVNYSYEFERAGKRLNPFCFVSGTYMRANGLQKDTTLNETYTVGRNKQWIYSNIGIGIVEKLSPNIFLKQSLGIGMGFTIFENRYFEGYYYNKTYHVIQNSSANLTGSFQFTIEFRLP